jgi:lauroyl/myristoyl acyltransferase
MWGRRLARWHRDVPGLPVTRPKGSFKVLSELLAKRIPLLLYFDMPGRHETRFLGKPAMMVNGTARLAIDAEALVVPIRCHREGHRVREEAFEPLDARDFAGVDELHQELADVHTRLILEYPEEMSAPSEFGWGDGATPEIWRRPSAGSDQGTR